MTSSQDLGHAIEASHRALDEIARGDPSAFFELYSRRDDVTIANPFGPPGRGAQVEEAGRRAASNYRDGRAIGFENFATFEGGELAYTLEIERFEAKVGDSEVPGSVALRVTSIYRREGEAWKLVHRHADPITSPRAAESVTGGSLSGRLRAEPAR